MQELTLKTSVCKLQTLMQQHKDINCLIIIKKAVIMEIYSAKNVAFCLNDTVLIDRNVVTL